MTKSRGCHQLGCALADMVVIDARSHDAYIAGRGQLPTSRHERRNRRTLRPQYCDGIGCNASTKGAYKLARLGFRVKELLGGLDWWRRDGHPVTASHEPGSLLAAAE